jgi:flagella synthesis protein FlgN
MPNRQSFIESLIAEREAFSRFLATLQSESAALLRGDVEELLGLAEAKSRLVERLSELGDLRRVFLGEAGFSADRVGMAEWLIIHGGAEQARLSVTWNSLLADAEQARDLNRTNGVLIESRLRFNQAALAALRDAMRQATLYGPDGSPEFKSQGRALGLA